MEHLVIVVLGADGRRLRSGGWPWLFRHFIQVSGRLVAYFQMETIQQYHEMKQFTF